MTNRFFARKVKLQLPLSCANYLSVDVVSICLQTNKHVFGEIHLKLILLIANADQNDYSLISGFLEANSTSLTNISSIKEMVIPSGLVCI